MTDDREIARHAVELHARAQDYRLMDLPGYMEWSERKLKAGESPALIAHIDATSMWLLPEETVQVTEADYNEILDELKDSLARDRIDG